eukprot:2275816-Rhodomonas_salina.2
MELKVGKDKRPQAERQRQVPWKTGADIVLERRSCGHATTCCVQKMPQRAEVKTEGMLVTDTRLNARARNDPVPEARAEVERTRARNDPVAEAKAEVELARARNDGVAEAEAK